MDAGYDVRDYKKVAKRYGTNEDAKRLFKEAHKRGIKVLLDLVAGHTSDEHEWFKASKKAQKNEYSDRYVWTNGAFTTIKDKPYISGMSDRDGVYMLNFFASQPALNYGWLNRTEKWMSEVDSKEAIATRNAIKDVICFWLEMGADGFRCDMADYLVKNDDKNKSATALVWADIRESIKNTYPNVAFVSEWCNPKQAINGAKFEMDFYLNHTGNGYNTLARDYENGEDNSFFLKKGKACVESEKPSETTSSVAPKTARLETYLCCIISSTSIRIRKFLRLISAPLSLRSFFPLSKVTKKH